MLDLGRASALLGVLVIGAALPACGASDASNSSSSVSVVGQPSGNQLHTFSSTDHAPFISLANYKPIYDRHGPHYVLVDVREAGERQRSYIPGDIWAPLADADSTGWQYLEQYKSETLVLYCDCPWAEAAKESVILMARGFSAGHMLVLHEGIPGWVQAGYPVSQNNPDPCLAHRWPQACG